MESVHMRAYCHYWDLNGMKKSRFLDFNLRGAIARCDFIKMGLWYQTNDHVQLLFPENER